MTQQRNIKLLVFFILITLGFFLFLVEVQCKKHTKKSTKSKNFDYIIQLLITKKCYKKYFSKLIFAAPLNCYSIILSKLLSLFIIIFVPFIRIPQIIKIVKNKSLKGLTFFGNNLEFLMPAMTFGYGIYARLPFLVYGQNIFIAAQSLIILVLFFIYPSDYSEKDKYQMKFYLLLILTLSFLFIFQLIPDICQQISIWLQLVIFLFGRGSQLVKNYQNKSTGNLSIQTVIITVCANLIRILTVLVDTPQDIAYLLNFLIPFFINSYILYQFYLYPTVQTNNLQVEEKQLVQNTKTT